MTISTETSSAGPYYGNNVTTVFPYGFKIVDEKHLRVVFIDAAGNVSDLSLDDGDYSVTGVGSEEGGTVVKASALLTGQTLTIVRNPPLTQETALENQGPYNASVVENRLDLMVMQIQSVKEATDRSFKVEPGQPAPSLELIASAEGFASAAQQSALDAAGSASDAADLETVYQGYLTTASEYVTQASQWSATAQDWSVKMDGLVEGSDYSAKYWAGQAYLQGGVPVGTLIQVYGNGTTTPPGYIKYVPGLEVTSALPQLRAFGLANGWEVNGNGNPVLPNVESPFLRGWRAGQTGNDAGRVFGSVQQDAIQNIVGQFDINRSSIGLGTGPFADSLNNGTGSATSGGTAAGSTVKFDASKVVRTATENRPVNITVALYIKAYDAPVDPSLLVAAQVISDLADVRTKVARGAKFAILQDQKASGTSGGSTVAAAWTTMVLNTKVLDADSIVSLSGNTFTPAIDCVLRAARNFVNTGQARMRLFNVTDNVEVVRGLGSNSGNSSSLILASTLTAKLLAGKTYRLEYWASSAQASTGLGSAVGDGGTEVFLNVDLQGIAA